MKDILYYIDQINKLNQQFKDIHPIYLSERYKEELKYLKIELADAILKVAGTNNLKTLYGTVESNHNNNNEPKKIYEFSSNTPEENSNVSITGFITFK